MLRRIMASVVATALICVASTAFGQLVALDGSWQPERGTMHGEVVPTSALGVMALVVSNGTFKASSGSLSSTGRMNQTGYLSNQFDLNIEGGADQGRLIKAIFKVENQMLTITYSESGEFPITHDSSADNKYLTLIYKKQGAAGSAPIVNVPPTGSSGTGSAVVD